MKFGENLQGHITHEWRTQVNFETSLTVWRVCGPQVPLTFEPDLSK